MELLMEQNGRIQPILFRPVILLRRLFFKVSQETSASPRGSASRQLSVARVRERAVLRVVTYLMITTELQNYSCHVPVCMRFILI